MYVHGIRALFPFPGYVVQKVTMAADIAQVVLRRDRRFRLACPACGATMAVSRTKTQTGRDLALGTARLVVVTYPAIQGHCSACGGWATIHPPGIDPHAKATRRLMHFVCRLARYMPLCRIPEIMAISKFHLIANYHAVIDEVRRSEWRKASAEDKAVIKGQRYNLFRSPRRRTGKQTRDLMALLHINENLAKAYILRESLRKLWDYKYPKAPAKYLAKWRRSAAVSGVEALRKFSRSLLRAKEQVLNYCKHRITTGRLEGFNNLGSSTAPAACMISTTCS